MQPIVPLIFMYLQLIYGRCYNYGMYFSFLTIQSQLLTQAQLRSMCDKIKVFKLYINTMESICICI